MPICYESWPRSWRSTNRPSGDFSTKTVRSGTAGPTSRSNHPSSSVGRVASTSTHDLPDEIGSVKAAEQYAAKTARALGLRCCLVLSRRISIWLAKEGSVEQVTEAVPGEMNSPYMSIGGRKFLLKVVDGKMLPKQVDCPPKPPVK